mgnify:CR=1 FL=1
MEPITRSYLIIKVQELVEWQSLLSDNESYIPIKSTLRVKMKNCGCYCQLYCVPAFISHVITAWTQRYSQSQGTLHTQTTADPVTNTNTSSCLFSAMYDCMKYSLSLRHCTVLPLFLWPNNLKFAFCALRYF